MEDAIRSVLALPHLQPCPEVNHAFSTLVARVIASDDDISLDASVVRAVQRRCAAAETELEQHWSARVAEAGDPRSTLDQFPYAENYRELTRRELALLEKSGLQQRAVSRAAVVGSGPLPLTAWWLHELTGAHVTHVDVSAAAIDHMVRLAQSLNWSCDALHVDGRDGGLAADTFDVIYIAGLAGETLAEKQQIVDAALPALKADGRLVMRGAWGARKLFYPAFAADAIQGVHLLEEYHPTDDVINSVFVYGRSPKGATGAGM